MDSQGQTVFWFSIRREGLPPESVFPPGTRVEPASLPREVDTIAPEPLLIECGHDPSHIDPARVERVLEQAHTQRLHGRAFASLVLLGDPTLLGSFEAVFWLKPDAVWPALRTEEEATCALRTFTEKARRSVRAVGGLEEYALLGNRLRIGAYRTDLHTGRFLWADDRTARVLGYRTVEELLRSNRTARDFYLVPAQRERLTRRLLSHPEHIASSDIDLRREDGTVVRVRVSALLQNAAGGQEMLGLLHDFAPMVDLDDDARDRVADLLEALGYAYFAADPKGNTIRTSTRDRELLGDPPDDELMDQPRDKWWAIPLQRQAFLEKLVQDGKVSDYTILARTWKNRRLWVEASCRLVRDGSGERREIEGIYRDATWRVFADRMASAVSVVGLASSGVAQTSFLVAQAAMQIFDARACAVMMRDSERRCVFPLRVETLDASWQTPLGHGCLFDEASEPWLRTLPETVGYQKINTDDARDIARALFGAAADGMQEFHVLPLVSDQPKSPRAVTGAAREQIVGYLWLPLTEQIPFSRDRFLGELEMFFRLCSTQLHRAAARDAFDLMHDLLLERTTIESLDDLDRVFQAHREKLQSKLRMEGCSIFRIGPESDREKLTLVDTSGLLAGVLQVKQPTYDLGEGLTGWVTQAGHTHVSFDVAREPKHTGLFVERTTWPPLTWAGVPMKDRLGKPVGIVRCVNRLAGEDKTAVTGFSSLDLIVLEDFARACALLIELTLMETERLRGLQRITHEISAPATGLRDNVGFLARTYSGDLKFKTKLADLELDSALVLNQVLQVDLLRGGGVRIPEKYRRIRLADIIQKTIHQLTPELDAFGFGRHSIRLVGFDSFPQRVWMQRTTFAQIVFNLIRNSVKYAHDEPERFRIEIVAEVPRGGDVLKLHFQDWGIGIDPKYRERIFEEQFRAPNAREHDTKGMGLGLTLCRKLAEDLGGSLSLHTCENPTGLVLVIPRALAAREPPGPVSLPPRRLPHEGGH